MMKLVVGILLLLCDVVYAGSDNLPALFTVKLYFV